MCQLRVIVLKVGVALFDFAENFAVALFGFVPVVGGQVVGIGGDNVELYAGEVAGKVQEGAAGVVGLAAEYDPFDGDVQFFEQGGGKFGIFHGMHGITFLYDGFSGYTV